MSDRAEANAGAEAVRRALRRLLHGEVLDDGAVAEVMEALLAGELSPVLVGAFATALAARGESARELAAAARVVRSHGRTIDFGDGPLIDTCGTGGDGASTFNISTVAAIVAAGAGARIVKHGNRAVTSRSGSADVLETLGIRLDVSEDVQRRCVDDAGIAFFFAPNHHQALRHAAAVRRELGVRTFFNLLGPLVNPAGATHQLMGVYDRKYVRACAEVLGHLGVAGAWVVHHESGLDEIGTVGRSFVARLSAGGVEEAVVGPEDFGLEPQPIASLAGGDAKTNAAIATRILEGERRGKDAGPRAAVVLNAAAALLAGGLASEPEAAATLAEDSIDEGRAMARLTRWRELTQ